MALINVDRCPYPNPISIKLKSTGKITNGNIVSIGDLDDVANQELYDGEKVTDGKVIAIIAEPFHPYSVTEKEEESGGR